MDADSSPTNPRKNTMGHHKIAAAIFVGLLILGGAVILAAELMKPGRYEFHALAAPDSYVLFDRDTGKATTVRVDSPDPAAALEK
jgi:hypothetical protein